MRKVQASIADLASNERHRVRPPERGGEVARSAGCFDAGAQPKM